MATFEEYDGQEQEQSHFLERLGHVSLSHLVEESTQTAHGHLARLRLLTAMTLTKIAEVGR